MQGIGAEVIVSIKARAAFRVGNALTSTLELG